MMKNLLILRLSIFNICAFALVTWAALLGYVQMVFTRDVSHISYIIAALFLVGLASTFMRAFKVGAAIDYKKEQKYSRPLFVDQDKARKMPIKAGHIHDIAEWLVTLGLIGNVVGFVIALSGVDMAAVGSADGAQKIAVSLLAGMGVAFYSTLVGAVTALWTSVNRRILETATLTYLEDMK